MTNPVEFLKIAYLCLNRSIIFIEDTWLSASVNDSTEMAPGTSIYMDLNSVSCGLEDEEVSQQVNTSTLSTIKSVTWDSSSNIWSSWGIPMINCPEAGYCVQALGGRRIELKYL